MSMRRNCELSPRPLPVRPVVFPEADLSRYLFNDAYCSNMHRRRYSGENCFRSLRYEYKNRVTDLDFPSLTCWPTPPVEIAAHTAHMFEECYGGVIPEAQSNTASDGFERTNSANSNRNSAGRPPSSTDNQEGKRRSSTSHAMERSI